MQVLLPIFFLSLPLLATSVPRDASDGSDAAAAARLVFEGLDGTRRSVPVHGLTLTDPRLQDAWLVRVEGLEPPPPKVGGAERGPRATIEFAAGDLLRGNLRGGLGETLLVELFEGVDLPVGIESIRSIVFEEHLPATLTVPLEAPPEGDRLYRRTGESLDRDDGAVLEFTAEGVSFESELLGTRLVRYDELAALFVEVFEEPTPSRPDAGGVPVAVDLTDGGRVRGSLVELAETGCRMRVVGETEILLPLARILEIAVDDGRLRFLSDLAPGTETGRGSPFGDELGMSWPCRIDRAAGGRALVAGGRRWARGIGMHAPSRVAWTLEPQWRRLRGFVAIDDRSLLHEPDARGSVVFRILVGGETVWESPVVRGGDDPLEIPALELGNADGARELVLEVDSVEDFRGDRADWLRLILVGD